MHLPPPPSGLGCCPFQGGGSIVLDALFIVAPTVGVLCFFRFVIPCVLSSFAIILLGRESSLLYFNCLPDVLRLYLL